MQSTVARRNVGVATAIVVLLLGIVWVPPAEAEIEQGGGCYWVAHREGDTMQAINFDAACGEVQARVTYRQNGTVITFVAQPEFIVSNAPMPSDAEWVGGATRGHAPFDAWSDWQPFESG